MSEIIKSEYNALGEDNNYKTHYFKTSADQVVGLHNVATSGNYNDLEGKPILVNSVNGKTGDVVVGDVTDLSISGRTITVTFADGTTETLTTQDTLANQVPNYSAGVAHSAVKNTEVSFTCPSDGVIVSDLLGFGSEVYLKINDTVMFHHKAGLSDGLIGGGQYIAKSGDTVVFKTTYANPGLYASDKVTFYPYR